MRAAIASEKTAREPQNQPSAMIRDGNQVRFTADEIDQFRAVGLDIRGVRRIEDFGVAVAKWCDLLDEVRPGLLEKVARTMAEARGVKLPPRLAVYDRQAPTD